MPSPLAREVPEFELSGWHNGSGTFGLKVLGGLEERDRFLPWRDKLEGECVDIVLPGKAGDVLVEGVSVTPSFWNNCPEFRDSRIRDWMLERQVWPWPYRDPPKYIGELNTDGARVTLRVSPTRSP